MMRRKLQTFVVSISLALCIATVAMWAWSYERQGWAKAMLGGSVRCCAILVGNYPGRLALEVAYESADAKSITRSRSGGAGSFAFPPLSTGPRWSVWSGETPPSTDKYDAYDMSLPDRPDLHQFAGIAWYYDNSYTSSWTLLVPHRYIAALLAAMPLRWTWLRYRTYRRSRRNGCILCGYDLRATPDRCPECGTESSSQRDALQPRTI